MGVSADMRAGGLVLMISSVMVIVLGILAPGGPLIDSVSQFDLVAANEVLGSHANLTHVMSLLFAFAMLLFLYGLVVIWKAVPTEGAMDTVSRLGILMVAFAVCCLIVTSGVNHVIVHVAQHGVGSEQPEAVLQDLGLTLQTVKFSLRYVAGTTVILGFVLLSFGLSIRFPAGFNRIAARVAFVGSVLLFIQLLIAEHYHNVDLDLIYAISGLGAVAIFAWMIILGVALYRGFSGFSAGIPHERFV